MEWGEEEKGDDKIKRTYVRLTVGAVRIVIIIIVIIVIDIAETVTVVFLILALYFSCCLEHETLLEVKLAQIHQVEAAIDGCLEVVLAPGVALGERLAADHDLGGYYGRVLGAFLAQLVEAHSLATVVQMFLFPRYHLFDDDICYHLTFLGYS